MKGKKEKKDYDQNIGLHEVFLESVPTALIITVISIIACKSILIIFVTVSRVDCYHYTTLCQLDSVVTGVIQGQSSISKLFVGENWYVGFFEFLITFSLSVFSASLGLAKCLKNGVARPIGDGGCLDGLLSCRHLLAFFACGLCLVARAVCLGIVALVRNH